MVVNGDSAGSIREVLRAAFERQRERGCCRRFGPGTITNEDGHTDRSRLMFHNFVTNRPIGGT